MEQQRRERARLDALQVGSPFPHPWWTAFALVGPSPRCLDEWLIIEISSSIRAKPEWKRKYKDNAIVSKWKSEIKEQCKDKTNYIDEVIEYVIKELEWYEEIESRFMGTSGFEVGFNEYISTSDTTITTEMKEKLKKEVSLLVESFGDDLDYHPGSDDKVLDLVHPSLFPLQYDITPIINNNNNVEIVKFTEKVQYAKKAVEGYGVSQRFQWLPALMKLEDGRFSFKSYINNLHPINHKDLYGSIENIFNSILPGLNYTLTRYASKEYLRVQVPVGSAAYSEDYHRQINEMYDRLVGDDAESGLEEKLEEFESDKSAYVLDIKPRWEERPEFDKVIDLKTFENVKVVVKLANIELTPERPSYSGGSWHVEGTINEDIIATVLYYYDMENITESKLSFRTAFEDPGYEQGDAFYNMYFYGLQDEDVMVRNIGSVEAKENRVVVFPNMYQHHVDAFELKDKTKPGYRKILCFFITDPYNSNVVSTEKVPPQQKEWWNDEELNYLYPGNTKQDILQLKLDSMWPLTMEHAKTARRELMTERSAYHDEDDEVAFQRHFSLCEH
ncbi:uncharacterized protein SPAPADRAFT_136773 [Spathaspora passalidarum NRRL Y-27907]|uniref:Uncharacterized protein n=1 Tax=Spathaspora passalidarum (strain NRRL Y-27907 / 11-Y1) TaxID=619300 RepID=G3AKK7_SPAPN|nr:uncharacterized protein SPAPADRAFT_136773 [Spathaspora passalidarum NRRL Y-27907]EGW33612.1 hypothetical protein SPAPADRAFT_136773 [Spathaspora passalidarum NRRL Y-27907]